MKWGNWYIVELSFRPSNLIHRAICKSCGGDSVILYGNYENPIATNTKRLYHFNVLSPIEEMNRS